MLLKLPILTIVTHDRELLRLYCNLPEGTQMRFLSDLLAFGVLCGVFMKAFAQAMKEGHEDYTGMYPPCHLILSIVIHIGSL